jgi:hypothetical protein
LHGRSGRTASRNSDGKGSVFFKTDETHIRSLTIDAKGNLIVGTEPGGLVLRVTPAGDGFVLYQMPKREVTAVAQAPDGAIYCRLRGETGSSPGAAAAAGPDAAVPRPAPGRATVGGGAGRRGNPAPPPPSTPQPAWQAAARWYRIDADGAPRRVWGHAQDVVYADRFRCHGRAILGAGNKGNIYRIESPTM